jgi:hypothetical protein
MDIGTDIFHLQIIPCVLDMQSYIFVSEEFTFYSYRNEQAMRIPFQSTELSNKISIHERIIYAIDIHRKGIESVFNQNHDNNYFYF